MTRLPVADRPAVREAARRLVADERRSVAFVAVLHIAAAVAGLAAPWLLGSIVDSVTAGGGADTVDRLALGIVVRSSRRAC